MTALLAAVLAAGAAAPQEELHQAQVLLTNGKTLHGKVEKVEDGYVIHFVAGPIRLVNDAIKEIVVEGADFEPTTDEEREMLAKGRIRYRGHWLTKSSYEKKLKKESKERAERLAEIKAHADFGKAWEEETKNFIYKCNVNTEVLDWTVSLFEDYYKLFTKVLPIPKQKGAKPKVHHFKNSADYQDWAGMPGTAGYFWSAENALNFYYDPMDVGFTTNVMLHEGMHLLTHQINPDFVAPTWINEGLAEYFGSSKVEKKKRGKGWEITPGQMLDHRLLTMQDFIKEEKYVRLDELFGKQFGAYGYTDYAHGWTFVHFLMESPAYGKKFRKYFRDLYTLKGKFKQYARGRGASVFISPEEVGKHLLDYLKKKDLKELEDEWIAFVRDEMVAEGGRGYFYLGRDMSMQGRSEEALKNLTKAIEELDYATPRAHYFRSKTYRNLGQREKATQEVRVALDKDPTNAEFRVFLASLLPKKEKVEAERQLKLACELEPDDATYPWRLEQFRTGGLFIF